jgi:NhaA family Na+:H+ antiporter
LITILSPIATFVIIPIYITINLLIKLDFSEITGDISVAVVIARCVGKVLGITFFAWVLTKFTALKLPDSLDLKEITGVGFLAGMGLTVSIVIAEITLSAPNELAQVRTGLFLAAIVSGLAGVLWLKRFPASL